MRIPVACSECISAKAETDQRAYDEAVQRGQQLDEAQADGIRYDLSHWHLADIEEDNAYVGKCPRGHSIRMTLQNVRYELLYESGIVAMLVGFQREAVSSIASALERFYEFAIEVLSMRHGVTIDAHALAWKLVAKSSERQFGAFLFLYLTNLRKPFVSGAALQAYEKQVSFRNDVIHQGRFPSRSDTLGYAKHVFDIISDTRKTLTEFDADAVLQAQLNHMYRGHRLVEKKVGTPQKGSDGFYRGTSTAGISTMLMPHGDGVSRSFEAALESSRANLAWWFPNGLAGL